MIGRPNDISMNCPRCTAGSKYPKTYGTFRAVYTRRGNRYVKYGRMCIDIPLEHQDFNERHRYGAKDKVGCGYLEKDEHK